MSFAQYFLAYPLLYVRLYLFGLREKLYAIYNITQLIGRSGLYAVRLYRLKDVYIMYTLQTLVLL
jgi:hypothetical protein